MALGDVLLARFKHAVAQSLLPSGAAGEVTQALDALTLLAAHADAAPLLESLLAWRAAAVGCVLAYARWSPLALTSSQGRCWRRPPRGLVGDGLLGSGHCADGRDRKRSKGATGARVRGT